MLKNEDAIPSAKTCHKTAELTHKPRVHRLKSCLHSYGQGHSCSFRAENSQNCKMVTISSEVAFEIIFSIQSLDHVKVLFQTSALGMKSCDVLGLLVR